jgi:hypothetical protein
MEEAYFQTLTAHEALDEARRRIAAAQTAIDTPTEAPRRVLSALGALQLRASSLLGAVRIGLARPEVADAALEHALSAGQAHAAAARWGRWSRREFAEDLRTCLGELIVASNPVAGLLRELQPHASQDTRDALDRSPMMLAVAREALAIRRPGTSVDDILERIALHLRRLIDTSDALRRGVEAALSRWREPGPC